MATYTNTKPLQQTQPGAAEKTTTRKVQLKNQEVYRLDRWQGNLHIQADSGILWVTIPGDAEDHLLQAGDRLSVSKHGTIVMQALKSSSFALTKV